ncbi:MAG: oxygen-independent coproporphyrinogen III oxidase [Bacteroidota bacterium]
MKISDVLIEKYNVPVPRYTSYPTVPYWSGGINDENWKSLVKRTFDETNNEDGISIYVHLPFCESLCTYCACNTRITKNHKVERPYVDSLLKEWDQYVDIFGSRPRIRELHLGGGTPTFLSSLNLKNLITGILERSDLHPCYSFSFEGHPNNTTSDHLETLFSLGFRRVSYGVQDLDYKVQKTINRIQPFENVKQATNSARSIGYESVNFDLVYGLPFQHLDSVENTVSKVLDLKPERIAFYSYAHVPWKHPSQRAYTENDLPSSQVKRELYELGKQALLAAGYIDVGMDHFALKGDALYQSYQNKTMHRNFMGYTEAKTDLLIGLGASAISDAKYGYAQNIKKVEDYNSTVESGIPIFKGHKLEESELEIRDRILSLTCKGELKWRVGQLSLTQLIKLNEMNDEGLIELYDEGLRITELGMAFLRNICAVFDLNINRKPTGDNPVFSKAI